MSGSSSRNSFTDLQRHPEIWFDDGNIVLVARQTAYRVYRGLLAAQSTIFHDLFASSTTSSDETFDGCPVVHLSDSPHDLTHLLRVLLPKSQISYRTPKEDSPRTFNEVSAVIRLAHKYNIPQIQAQALASLQEHHFPSTFAGFSNQASHKPEVDMEPAHFIGAVNLARLTNTPLMLPMALYRCSYLDTALIDGWTREDGTVEHLSTEDLKRCMHGRIALERERSFLIFTMFFPEASAHCKRPEKCLKALRDQYESMMCIDMAISQSFWLSRFRHGDASEALSSWILDRTVTDTRHPLCGICRKKVHQRNERAHKMIFEELPNIFGITVEGWAREKSESTTEGDSALGAQ